MSSTTPNGHAPDRKPPAAIVVGAETGLDRSYVEE
jgi:hypothetical protein